ncbi:hypothetical protein [Leifsonia poae]
MRADFDGTVTASGCAAQLDPTATLTGYHAAGRDYRIHADGRVEEL